MKVTEILQTGSGFSAEFFPPKTQKGVQDLVAKAQSIAKLGALFFSVTWTAGGAQADTTLEIARILNNELEVPTVLHLTCTNMHKDVIDAALAYADTNGIDNILALRGDSVRNDYAQASEMTCAQDLVKYIRAKYGMRFCIGVAGYPDGHCVGEGSNADLDADLEYLRNKVRAGADFIVTQMVFDAESFRLYKQRLESDESGVFNIPIIPGVMPINRYDLLLRICKLCHVRVPQALQDALHKVDVKNDEQVKAVGVEIMAQVVRELLDAGAPCVHFYTLNLERSVAQLVEKCGLACDARAKRPAILESVETAGAEYPNGRYSSVNSAAFGEIDGYGPVVHGAEDGVPLQEWGPLCSEADIGSMFARHITTELRVIPFSEQPLDAETGMIQEELLRLIGSGLWTLGSQPACKHVDSSDHIFGWGASNGKVSQRPFVEFLVDREQFMRVEAQLSAHKDIAVYYGDVGGFLHSNNQQDEVCVTWGVWNGERVESTIIGKQSFELWREEAFGILKAWQGLYRHGSTEHELLAGVMQSRVLVTVIDLDEGSERSLWRLLCRLFGGCRM